jgi:hypothetical protein
VLGRASPIRSVQVRSGTNLARKRFLDVSLLAPSRASAANYRRFLPRGITRGAFVDVPAGSRLLSYQLCYCWVMAQRDKRSVSFPPDLAKAIDAAAAASGTSFSAWIADTASHRLRLEAGRRGVAEWEAEHGPLSEPELAEGLARARELLGRTASKRSA